MKRPLVLTAATLLAAAVVYSASPSVSAQEDGQRVNPAAAYRAQTSSVCVTPAVDGGVYLDGDGGLANRKYIYAQNLGPTVLWCTAGGAIPTVNRGIKIAADPTQPFAADLGSSVRLRCTTTTAQDNVDAGCTTVVEAR